MICIVFRMGIRLYLAEVVFMGPIAEGGFQVPPEKVQRAGTLVAALGPAEDAGDVVHLIAHGFKDIFEPNLIQGSGKGETAAPTFAGVEQPSIDQLAHDFGQIVGRNL